MVMNYHHEKLLGNGLPPLLFGLPTLILRILQSCAGVCFWAGVVVCERDPRNSVANCGFYAFDEIKYSQIVTFIQNVTS